MKIGMTTFGGDGGKSGISQYIVQLLRQFQHMQDLKDLDLFLYEKEQNIFGAGCKSVSPLSFSERLRNPIVNVAWHQTSLPSWCERRKYDVLFLPAGNRRLPVSCPCPTVGTVHDFSSLHVKGKYDWARLFYIKQVLPRLVRRLTRVLTVSESSKRDIVEYAGVPEERVIVTPLGVDHDLYYPRPKDAARDRVRVKYGLDRPYLFYVSRLEHPGKNHVRLIEAFDLLKRKHKLPHQLVLSGGDWNGAQAIHEAAHTAQSRDDIVFTGFAPTADLPDLYSAADLFVFPSLYEGFGLPLLEAMACGAPTACSNVSSLPEVGGDASVLFDPYEMESIAEAILPLLEDEETRRQSGNRGVERAEQFTWAATAGKTLEVIHEASLGA